MRRTGRAAPILVKVSHLYLRGQHPYCSLSERGCPEGVRCPTCTTDWTLWHLSPTIHPSNSRLQKSFSLVPRKPIASFFNIGSDKHALYKITVFLWMCSVESISSTNPICSVSITNILRCSALAEGTSFLPEHWDIKEIHFPSERKIYQEKRERECVLSPLG